MLVLEKVSKRFPAGNYGVRDVSLTLTAGVVGLLGPNGAGKATLMQMIATITRPSAGRILFRGEDPALDFAGYYGTATPPVVAIYAGLGAALLIAAQLIYTL